MIVKKYRVTHVGDPENGKRDKWVIELGLEPRQVDRFLFGKIFPEKKILTGSCMYWHWNDGSCANFFWCLWAYALVKRHSKIKGSVYAQRRSN